MLELASSSLEEQQTRFELEFDNCKGEREQLDDLLLTGVRIS